MTILCTLALNICLELGLRRGEVGWPAMEGIFDNNKKKKTITIRG